MISNSFPGSIALLYVTHITVRGPGPGPACAHSQMLDYVYTDHAQYTIKTYAKMALFPLVLTGPLSL